MCLRASTLFSWINLHIFTCNSYHLKKTIILGEKYTWFVEFFSISPEHYTGRTGLGERLNGCLNRHVIYHKWNSLLSGCYWKMGLWKYITYRHKRALIHMVKYFCEGFEEILHHGTMRCRPSVRLCVCAPSAFTVGNT